MKFWKWGTAQISHMSEEGGVVLGRLSIYSNIFSQSRTSVLKKKVPLGESNLEPHILNVDYVDDTPCVRVPDRGHVGDPVVQTPS